MTTIDLWGICCFACLVWIALSMNDLITIRKILENKMKENG